MPINHARVGHVSADGNKTRGTLLKRVRLFTGTDGKSHAEIANSSQLASDPPDETLDIRFVQRRRGPITPRHPASHRQYVIYLTARVRVGLADGSTILLDPGDVLLAEDVVGEGHSSQVLDGGLCAIIRLP